MTFTTPCFVWVEDAAEREKLIEWMKDIGYEYVKPPKEELFGHKVVCDLSCFGTSHDEHTFATAEYIDAGTSVDLFKALAAMNDENDREQWFFVQKDVGDLYGRIIKHNGELFFNKSYKTVSPVYFRKATAEEIVEYFTKK